MKKQINYHCWDATIKMGMKMRDDIPFTPSSKHFCWYIELKKLY